MPPRLPLPACRAIRRTPPPPPLPRSLPCPHRRILPPVRTNATSSTSISAQPKTISPAIANLKETLRTLDKNGYGNTSRIQLALRSLEQDDAPVRIAVLGTSAHEAAEALLRDPLKPHEKETEWVKALREWGLDTTKKGSGLLIRYGSSTRLAANAGSPISMLAAPIDLLKTHNFELLLSHTLPTGDILVPTFQATSVPGARVIEYPVHKTILYTNNKTSSSVSDLLQKSTAAAAPNQVLKLVSLPTSLPTTNDGEVKFVNVDLALDALEQIQVSSSNAVDYEHEWLQSGLEVAKDWVLSGTTPTASQGLKSLVKDLIQDTISKAESQIATEAKSLSEEDHTLSNAVDTTDTLSTAISHWSKSAHLELRDSLEAAFLSKKWRKLEWWKLLWRVDDVSLTTKALLRTNFLRSSEKHSFFLAGRIYGAGFRNALENENQSPEDELEHIKATTLGEADKRTSKDPDRESPGHITRSRQELIKTKVPPLQYAAQKYLLSALSTSALSWATSALLYLSEISLYSSLTVAAVGTIGSMRYLQTRWWKERRQFRELVREKGREAIVGTESWAWERLRKGIRVDGKEEEKERERLEQLKRMVGEAKKAVREA